MPVFAALAAALIFWAWYTKRISIAQLPALLLGVAGAYMILRGQLAFGAGAVALGSLWFLGTRRRISQQQTRQYAIDKARQLLGANAHDDAENIKRRHRKLMAENHPDLGGSQARAQALNEARDLLLAELEKQN